VEHRIPVETLGHPGEVMAQAIAKCVHCGFCLPACPTYHVLKEEMDSPRGRIVLMKGVLEGELELEEALPYLDRCLGCLGCVSACPSGVPYGSLIGEFRAYSESRRHRSPFQRLYRLAIQETLPYPQRFQRLVRLGQLVRGLSQLSFTPFKALKLIPRRLPPPSSTLPERVPAEGERRAQVALLAGCVQQVLEPEINWATLRVLSRNGVEVIIPKDQVCCGALALHTGERSRARKLAETNLKAFPSEVEAILSNAAGCGSGMREYGELFAEEPLEALARGFSAKVQDVSFFLARLGLREVPKLKQPLRVAYHDPCHLAHAQGVRAEPRALLRQIEGLELLEIPEGELCCGSAGTYNLEQPEVAEALGRRKAEQILKTGAQAVATGNIGCATQIAAHLEALGHPLPIYHTLELLDLAYRGEL
jgi:glycolate oxidase iron-sulfur subunit